MGLGVEDGLMKHAVFYTVRPHGVDWSTPFPVATRGGLRGRNFIPNHIEKALVLPAFLDSVPRKENDGWAAAITIPSGLPHNLASCHQAKYTEHANSHPLDRQLRPAIRTSRPTSFET